MIQKFGLLSLAFLVSCAGFAPKPEETIGKRKPVYTELLNERRGELALQSSGVWAFIAEDASKLKKHDEGTLLVYADVDSRSQHLFALVSNEMWGYALQRLDTEPLTSQLTGDLIPLNDVDAQVARRWDFCIDDSCLEESADGVYWHFYARQKNRLRNLKKTTFALPFQRTKLLHISPLGRFVAGQHEGDFIAVPGNVGPKPGTPIVTGPAACGFDSDESLRFVQSKGEVPSHPLSVELRAASARADLVLSCANGFSFAIPGLFRAPLPGRVAQGSAVGLTMAARTQTSQHSASVKAAAFAAIGSYEVADFWLEVAARKEAERPFLLDAADVALAASRPEAAIRMAHEATSGAWNRDTNGRYVLLASRVEEVAGNEDIAAERRVDLIDIIETERDDAFGQYLAFFKTRDQLRKSKEMSTVPKETVDPWKNAFAVEGVRLGLVDSRRTGMETLRPLFDLAEQRLRGDVGYANSYEFPNDQSNLDGVSTVRGTLFKTFTLATWATFVKNRPHAGAATIHLLEEEAQKSALSEVTQWLSTYDCSQQVETKYARHADLRDLSEPGSDLAWATTAALNARCSGTLKQLVDTLDEETDRSSRNSIALALLFDKISEQKSVEFAAIKSLFDIAKKSDNAEVCTKLGLVLTVKLIEAKDFERAHQIIGDTANCDSNVVPSTLLLSAYLSFEKTRSVSTDFDDMTKTKLRDAIRIVPTEAICPATVPLEYKVLSFLPQEIRDFGQRVGESPKVDDAVRLVFASDLVAEGAAELKAVAEAVASQDYNLANEKLKIAEEKFNVTRNLPGLRRAKFLRTSVFSGEKPSATFKALKSKKANNSTTQAARWILYSEKTNVTAELYPVMCAPIQPDEKEANDQPSELLLQP